SFACSSGSENASTLCGSGLLLLAMEAGPKGKLVSSHVPISMFHPCLLGLPGPNQVHLSLTKNPLSTFSIHFCPTLSSNTIVCSSICGGFSGFTMLLGKSSSVNSHFFEPSDIA